MLNRIGGVLKTIFGYPTPPVNRREFISFAARSAALGASAGFLIWDQATRPAETRPTSRALGRNELLEQRVLGVLEAVEKNQSMSPRYGVFISKVTELIKKRELTLTTAENLGSGIRDFNAIYHPDTNTIEVDMADTSNFNKVEFNAVLIHELFHAYQASLGMPMKKSRMEAEAYLAEGDYLYHNNQTIPDSWYAYLEASQAKTLPHRFNVPISLLKKVMDVSFDSHQYRRAIETIGDEFIWTDLYRHSTQPNLQISVVVQVLSQAQLSKAQLRFAWEKVCKDIVIKPADASRLNGEQKSKIAMLIVTAQFYGKTLFDAGKTAEVKAVMQKTIETFRRALRLTNLSKQDTIITFRSGANRRGR